MRTPQAETNRRHVLGVLGVLSLASGCASIGAGLAPGPDDAPGGLQGQASFFDARTGKYLNRRSLIGSLAPAPILLLGEIHDNADHHRLRGTLLRQWVGAVPGRPAAIVFEHFDREHDEALRLAQRQLEDGSVPASQLTQLLDAAGFDRRSWGWPVHLPLFEAALASGATWIAANLSRESGQRLSRDPGAVDPALQAMVQSARWSEQAQQALEQALIRGHCNALPDAAAGRLARIQRLRDAALALPLLDASDRRSALLAGNGHVRRDYGVPRYLGAFEKEALVVGFDEVVLADLAERAGAQACLSGYVGETRARELGQAYDLVCLTTVAGRDDGCAGIGVGAVSPAAPMQTPSR